MSEALDLAISDYVRRQLAAQSAVLEEQCVQAMMLTDYDRLESLQVVYVAGIDAPPSSVACSLEQP